MRARVVIVIQLFLLVQPRIAGQNGVLKFTDDQERNVVENVHDDIASINITVAEFEATVTAVGRANRLSQQLLGRLKVEDRQIYDTIQNITTSVRVTQGSKSFYVRGLNSTNLARFRTGQTRVRCHVYLLEVRSKAGLSYLPIITAIQTL